MVYLDKSLIAIYVEIYEKCSNILTPPVGTVDVIYKYIFPSGVIEILPIMEFPVNVKFILILY